MPLPDPIAAFIDAQAERSPVSYEDLRVVVFNGTTKRSPEPSHTDGLLAIPQRIFSVLGVRCDEVRTVDRTIPPGLWPDMREHGYEEDEFPDIYRSLVRARRHHPACRPDLAGRSELADPHDHRAPVRLLQRESTTAASGPTTARSAAC